MLSTLSSSRLLRLHLILPSIINPLPSLILFSPSPFLFPFILPDDEDDSFESSGLPSRVLTHPRLYAIYLAVYSVGRHIPVLSTISVRFIPPVGWSSTAMGVISIFSLLPSPTAKARLTSQLWTQSHPPSSHPVILSSSHRKMLVIIKSGSISV
ncbi:hypothetical protein LINGRAHAP2_LOCUS20699 [Linum grandiflorum]